MAPQVEPERRAVPQAADEADVLREQLDYLIGHTAHGEQCGCSKCRRYLRVRSILLEIFVKPPQSNVHEMQPPLAKAA